MARPRTGLGRRKIEIRRIEDEQARYVCFSKRRPGLFKKCSELATLCGVEVAAVVFSPATTEKAFSFGHPSVEAIIERFDPTGILVGDGAAGEDGRLLAELSCRGVELSARVDAEMARKERGEAAMGKERANACPVAKWLQANVRNLGEEELVAYAAAMDVMKAAVAAHSNQVLQDARNHDRAVAATAMARSFNIIRQALLAPTQQFFLANHSGAMAGSSNGNYQVQAPPHQFLLAHNYYQVQAPPPHEFLLANINYQVQAPPPQQLILTNHGAGFLYQFGAGNANNNNAAEFDMQIQHMMMPMAMPPSPGFAGAGMEMMQLQQEFGGFPGPY